ncbi:restriction endonuclease subunit S [Aeromonas veronii]|uniref:restriction endonuclease subunit S n=1 Tax=Aeromonas veronii TaxID=654 RepID=UPI002230791E|nr:restriction endonuclease subunit S [Aeromonas veronii]UZE59228.1 restriction endonuclease subunit S [Aeromonas veronii]
MAEQMKQNKAGEMAAKQIIPAGYKQTEVGVIPEDWEVFQLGDISDFVTSGSRGWAKYYSISGALFIRSQNVRDGKLCFVDSQHVNIPQGTEGGRTKVKLNDLLVTITGNSVGNVALASQEFEEAYISQHVGLVRLKDSSIGSYVCRYLSPNAPGNLQIQESQSGQSKPGLNLQNLKDFLVAVPKSKDEAKKITSALDDTDALIVGLEKAIAKKQALKTATIQQLLTGRTRLPKFGLHPDGTPKGYKSSELGKIPEDWKIAPLGALSHIKTGSKNNQDKVHTGQYPFFVRSEKVEWINTFSYDCEAILIPGEGGIGSIFHYVNGKFEAHQRVYVIRDFLGVDGKFLHLWFRQYFGAHAMENSVKATVDSLRLPTFQEFLVALPTIEEQTAIATILSDMDSQLTALEQKLAKARSLKQGMMQQLLTGRIRLPLEVQA